MRDKIEAIRSSGKGDSCEVNREPTAVNLSHVAGAFADKLGIPREVVEHPVDWESKLALDVPFQREAARELGRFLQTRDALAGTIVGCKIAIGNARDLGENELLEAIAKLGFGNRAMISRLDLATFWHLELLLQSSLGNSEVVGGISILGKVLKARTSGLVVFDNFDQASPTVQQFLLAGVAAGHMSDHAGRELFTRSFVVAFLNSCAKQERGLGFSTAKNRSGRQDGGLLGAVDVAVTLEQPQPDAVAPVVLSQAAEEFTKRTGLRVQVATSAEDYLKGLPADRALTARRSRMLRAIEEAVAAALRTAGIRGRDFVVWAEEDGLRAKVSATVQDCSCGGRFGDDQGGSSVQIERDQDGQLQGSVRGSRSAQRRHPRADKAQVSGSDEAHPP